MNRRAGWLHNRDTHQCGVARLALRQGCFRSPNARFDGSQLCSFRRRFIIRQHRRRYPPEDITRRLGDWVCHQDRVNLAGSVRGSARHPLLPETPLFLPSPSRPPPICSSTPRFRILDPEAGRRIYDDVYDSQPDRNTISRILSGIELVVSFLSLLSFPLSLWRPGNSWICGEVTGSSWRIVGRGHKIHGLQ